MTQGQIRSVSLRRAAIAGFASGVLAYFLAIAGMLFLPGGGRLPLEALVPGALALRPLTDASPLMSGAATFVIVVLANGAIFALAAVAVTWLVSAVRR